MAGLGFQGGLHIDTSAASASQSAFMSPVQAVPSFQLSPSPDVRETGSRLRVPLDNAAIARDRMDAEKRKALAFLIGQLQARPRVPSAFEPFRVHAPPQSERRGFSPINSLVPVPYALSKKDAHPAPAAGSDDEDDGAYSKANVLCDQVAGMCNFLIHANRDGWQGLHQSYTAPVEPKSPVASSPFRRRGSGLDARLSDTARDSQLTQCISVLASLVAEDCRMPPPRASVRRPPYTLHAHTLDFASALAETQLHDPLALSDIGFAMIPAFATFPTPLLLRLLRFFHYELLHPMLDRLRAARTGRATDDLRGPHPLQEPGMISIHVDEVQDTDSSVVSHSVLTWTPWSNPRYEAGRIVASSAARQSQLVYRLSSLITPLLSALFNAPNIAPAIAQLDVAHESCRLLDTIVRFKPDAYVDVLETLAFHTTTSRPFAAGILSSVWPKAFGHAFVGSPLPTFAYPEVLSIYTARQMNQTELVGKHPLTHEFIIWRFTDDVHSQADAPHSDCQVCSISISGLGLLCPFCMCCVHMQCYDDPAGTLIRSSVSSSKEATRTNPVLKFSRVLPARRATTLTRVVKNHPFNLVHLFTLTLCGVCQKPLWGISMQGFLCAACGVPVHDACLRSGRLNGCKPNVPPSHHSVDLATLRRTFVEHYNAIVFTEDDLFDKSYEELSVAYSVLWTQLQILGFGLSNFTINIETQVPGAPKQKMEDFELQYLVKLYEAKITSELYQPGAVLTEFLHTRRHVAEHMLLYNWSVLAYVASLIKTPIELPGGMDGQVLRSPSQDLLTASTYDPDEPDDAPQAYEIVEVAHLRDVLGHDLHLTTDRAAMELLQHVANLGFFARIDGEPRLNTGSEEVKSLMCVFPLPIALDVNGDNVETLVSAIEACLADISITVNETGFLLLVRRCWPSSRHTEYALSRLARVVLQWIFAEDERLVVVARDFDRAGIAVPGVPHPNDLYPWPKTSSFLRENKRVSSNYVGYRRFLLQRYALRWLRALHDQDAEFYATTLFTHATDFAAEMDALEATDTVNMSERESVDAMIARADQILKFITKLCQSSVIFSTFDSVMRQWLKAITSLCVLNPGAIVFKSLPRLCNSDTDRSSTVLDAMPGVMTDRFPTIDLWRVVDETAQQGGPDLLEALQWMRVMAQSGVDIPINTFKQLAGVIRDSGSPLEQAATLVEAMVAGVWLKPARKQALQRLITQMHGRYSDFILEQFRAAPSPQWLKFIRHSMSVCLLLAGCDRETVVRGGLLQRSEVDPLPRRNIAPPRPERPDPLDSDLIMDLVRYVTDGPESVAPYVATFFTCLLAEQTVLETQELAEIVILNGHSLSTCVWHLYDIQLHSLSVMRMKFLLHVLVVDSQPFENILAEIFMSPDWELRFQALTRLFRIILDVTNPQFYVDGHQWRAAVAVVFVYFFEALWRDQKETVRLAADTWVQTLLPAHIDAIAACWDAYVSTAPLAGKARVVSFLAQLQPHFPKWQTLTWTTIVEVLLEELAVKGLEDESFSAVGQLSGYGFPSSTSVPNVSQDIDPNKQRIILMTLAFQMVANGIPITVPSLLKLKMHLARILGFTNVELAVAALGHDYHVTFGSLHQLPETAFPCINPMLKVLDAAERIRYPLSAMGVASETDPLMEGLVGEFFADIALRVLSNATNLAQLPYVVQRGLIESLIVIIHKHDVEANRALKALQGDIRSAVRAVTDLILLDASYEIRYIALTAALVFLKRYPKLCAKIINHQVHTVMTLLSGLTASKDDMLVGQGRNFLVSAFSQFTTIGLFWNLAKKPLSQSVFAVLHAVLQEKQDIVVVTPETPHNDSLKDMVLRSTLLLALEQTDEGALGPVLENLKTFVEEVHLHGYTVEMIQFVGVCLAKFATQTADWDYTVFNPNPLISLTTAIIKHNRAQSRDLLGQLEDFLRAVLRKFDVTKDSLDKSLQAGTSFIRRGGPWNNIAIAILDVLSNALNSKINMSTTSLRAITEILSSQSLNRNNRQHVFPPDQIIDAAGHAVLFLSTLTVPDRYQQSDVYAFLSTAALVLHAARHDPGFLPTVIAGTRMRVRTWNLLVLQALRESSPSIAVQLFGYLPLYAQAFETELQVAFTAGGNALIPPPAVIGDVTHAATGARLWLLLARRRFTGSVVVESQPDTVLEDMARLYDPSNPQANMRTNAAPADQGEANVAEWRVWNELWPALERFARSLVQDGTPVANGTLAELAWAQLVDLVHFARLSQSAVAQEISNFAALLERMQSMPLEKSLSTKLARTVNAFNESPAPTPFDTLVAQTADQLWIAEKAYSAMNMGAGLGMGQRRNVDGARRRAAMATA
ncbi:hypothetical protein EXIGLDRAFT_720571 [Exidia glandulosa HHB12029]|uniref:Phorbol-ester/DAG-type domain-containing protein n=1 Tax=Exidia glandulosa HHB12029 TaxID=1314781 RepID=A0A165GB15_EXIGL|nr:hypothetical protein EXIGLDRAFT_720571 [Exidia glandulosa HHB12029]